MTTQTYAQAVNHVPNVANCAAALVFLAIGLTISGCQTNKYVLRGQVLSTNPTNTEITVKHEEIPGFMPAMTMS